MIRVRKLFEVLGGFLVDRLRLDQPGKGKSELQQELVSLAGGRKGAVRNYYIKKIQFFLLVFFAGIFLSLLGLLTHVLSKNETIMQSVGRPGYGEGDKTEELTVEIEGQEEKERLEITVQERKYTDEEKQKLLDTALENLDQVILGNNLSLDQVRGNLIFPESMEQGAVKVTWLTVPYGVIGEDGSIKGAEDENGTLVDIQATLACGGKEAVYEVSARVFPPELSKEEYLRNSIQKEVEQADARDSNTDALKLPDVADGKVLTWSKASDNPFPAMLVLTLIAAMCVYLEMDSRVHKRAEERKKQLMLDYPDLMWKMTMLLGAGLSIKGTFERIAKEYLRETRAVSGGDKKRGKKAVLYEKLFGGREKGRKRYVYEEVMYTCYEMESGISEAQAYERFGKRCQLPEYIRLGSVLSQNLKKGAKGLTSLLEEEAEASMNDRRNHARKIGEQAGTKLLLPMVMMLGIVLAILMVPAFLSF